MGDEGSRERIAAVFKHYLALRKTNQTRVRQRLAEQFPHVANSPGHISQIANGRTGARSTLIDAIDIVLETNGAMGKILREANELPSPELNVAPESGFRATVVTLTASRTNNPTALKAAPHKEAELFAHIKPVAVEAIENGVACQFDFGVTVAARTHTAVYSNVTDLAVWASQQTHTLAEGLPDPYHCVYIKEHKYGAHEIETITSIASGLPQLTTATTQLDGFEQRLVANNDTLVGVKPFNCPQLSYGYATRDGLAHYRKCPKHALTDQLVTVTAVQVQAALMLTVIANHHDNAELRAEAAKKLDRVELAFLTRLRGRHSHRQQKLVDTLTAASEIALRTSNAKRRIQLEQNHNKKNSELPDKPS